MVQWSVPGGMLMHSAVPGDAGALIVTGVPLVKLHSVGLEVEKRRSYSAQVLPEHWSPGAVQLKAAVVFPIATVTFGTAGGWT